MAMTISCVFQPLSFTHSFHVYRRFRGLWWTIRFCNRFVVNRKICFQFRMIAPVLSEVFTKAFLVLIAPSLISISPSGQSFSFPDGEGFRSEEHTSELQSRLH